MQQTIELFEKGLGYLADYPWLQALIIVAVFYVLGRIAVAFVVRAAAQVTRRTKSAFDDRFIDILRRPLFVSIMLVGLSIATGWLDLGDNATRYTLSALKTIGIFVWLAFGIRFSAMLLDALALRGGEAGFVRTQTVPLLRNVLMILLIGGAVYLGFSAWGVQLTALLAGAGIVGLALSFAAKDTLSNLFAGMSILTDTPYKIGDYVQLDTGERGEIRHIGLRSTRMLTRDDVEITIPNAVMGNAKITNQTGGPSSKFRIRVAVGVAYGSDIDKVQAVLLDVADKDSQVCREPEARVRFRQFGASSLDFELLAWVDNPALRGKVVHDLNCATYKAFQANDITIPFPQRDLHIKQMPDTGRLSPAG